MGTSYIWRALPLSTSSDIPALLASIHLGAATYTVRVTDTANIWVESLDRKQICMRAWGENTSIDPSDTPENMNKLLDSLRSALDPSHQNHAQTSLSLSPAVSSNDGTDSLILNITCELPGLSPLKWPVQLKKKPSSSLATDLVLPLIQGQYSRTREIRFLTEMLSQKDAVMSRLLDKLESTGTGLEHVFNSLSSKKKVSRATAEAKIKGLAPFDKDNWQSQGVNSDHEPENTPTLLTSVFGNGGLVVNTAFEAVDTPGSDNWWHDLKETVQISHRAQLSKSEQDSDVAPPVSNAETGDEDDDFQAQPSSQAATSSKQVTKMQETDDISTASESGEGEPDHKPNTTKRSVQPTGGKIGRVGVIGSRKQTEQQRSPPAPTLGKGKATIEVDGSDTATDASDGEEVKEAAHSPPRQEKSNVPSRGKIGRIGVRVETSVSESEPSVSKDTSDVPKASHAPKLGMIGKGSKIRSAANPSEHDERSRKSEATEPSHRETSAERADRRREELKRDLERKAAAGPTKKKRKF